MFDFQVALTGERFERITQSTIRKHLPSSLDFELDLPSPSGKLHRLYVELGLKPHRVGVNIEEDGNIQIMVEIEIYLKQLRYNLDLNEYLPAGQPIGDMNVRMDEVPAALLDVSLEQMILLGVPGVRFKIVRFEQGTTNPEKTELIAVSDLATLTVMPNLGGMAQVITRLLSDSIVALIHGAFGCNYLASILSRIVDFGSIVLRHVLVLGKLPDILSEVILAQLQKTFREIFGGAGYEKKFSIGYVNRRIELAKGKPLPSGGVGPSVETRLASINACVNTECFNTSRLRRSEFLVNIRLLDPSN